MPRDSNSSMGRMVLVRVLVVVGALFAVLALLAGYIRYQALDTDTVEQTAGELIADPEIRNQIAATMVDQLYANVDVEAALKQRLGSGPSHRSLGDRSPRPCVRAPTG